MISLILHSTITFVLNKSISCNHFQSLQTITKAYFCPWDHYWHCGTSVYFLHLLSLSPLQHDIDCTWTSMVSLDFTDFSKFIKYLDFWNYIIWPHYLRNSYADLSYYWRDVPFYKIRRGGSLHDHCRSWYSSFVLETIFFKMHNLLCKVC